MSHGVQFYIKQKNKEGNPLPVFSFGGYSSIYTDFRENGFEYNDYSENSKYQELSDSDIKFLIEEKNKDIKSANIRIDAIKSLTFNESLIGEMTQAKEYLNELESEVSALEFLATFIKATNIEGNSVLYNTY